MHHLIVQLIYHIRLLPGKLELKDYIKPETNTSDQNQNFQDAETKTKSENNEVNNEELNNKNETKQVVTNVDKSLNTEITDADKNIINKEI